MKDDLWGDIPDASKIVTPLEVLKEQAVLLADKTRRRLSGAITTFQSTKDAPFPFHSGKPNETLFSRDFHYGLEIVAPSLNNYSYSLLEIAHEITLYPVWVYDVSSRKITICGDHESYKAALTAIMRLEKTRDVIAALLKQTAVR